MHNMSKEMAKWALEKAKAYGYDNLTRDDWEELMFCMKAACCGVQLDKDYNIVEAMKEEKDEEKLLSKMGYTYPRVRMDNNGHRISVGYTKPYMEEDDYMAGYLRDPEEFRHAMRMGYTNNNNSTNPSNNQNGGNNGNYGYDGGMSHSNNSAHGVAYDNFRHARRNYTYEKTPEKEKDMDEAICCVMDDIQMVATDMWKDMTPAQRTKYKTVFQNMIQKLPA